MATVQLSGNGFNEVETVAADKTLDLGDSGVVQNVTGSKTVTLPATTAKLNFTVRVGAESITVTISPNASDKIAGYGAINTGAGADNKDLIFTNQPVGSFVQLQGDGTDGFTVTRISGTATFEA